MRLRRFGCPDPPLLLRLLFVVRCLGWNAAQAAEPEPQPALPSKEYI